MTKTTVDNIRNYDRDNLPSHCILIDRTTIFGNPFRMNEYGGCSRKEVISRFKRYFDRRIKYDVKFRNAVKEHKGKTLLCWCHPMGCHGDVIAEYLNQ